MARAADEAARLFQLRAGGGASERGLPAGRQPDRPDQLRARADPHPRQHPAPRRAAGRRRPARTRSCRSAPNAADVFGVARRGSCSARTLARRSSTTASPRGPGHGDGGAAGGADRACRCGPSCHGAGRDRQSYSDAWCTQVGSVWLVELESEEVALTVEDTLLGVRSAVGRLTSATTVADLLDVAAVEIRRTDRVRPGDGLPLRPRLERPGGRRGQARPARVVPRPALPGLATSRRRPGPSTRSTCCGSSVTSTPSTPARAGGQPADRGPAGPLAGGPAQRLADPLRVPPQHGRHRLDVGLAHDRRRAGRAGRLPPLLRALRAQRRRCGPPASSWPRPCR